MKCARCQKHISKPAAKTAGGLAVGPTCARKMGLNTGRARTPRTAEQAGQLTLFDEGAAK